MVQEMRETPEASPQLNLQEYKLILYRNNHYLPHCTRLFAHGEPVYVIVSYSE